MKLKVVRRNPWIVAVGIALVLASTSYLFYIIYIYRPLPIPAPIGQPTLDPARVSAHSPQPSVQPYSVPATHPKQLIIDKLDVKANILSVGTLSSGALDAPKTAWNVGWYKQSALPGLGVGALLIDGHVNDALNSPGVFYHLNTLTSGDRLQIIRGDGQVFIYSVTEVDQVPTEQVNMAKMLQPITPGQEGLNLITCGGVYNYTLHTYSDRVLVYATRTS